MSGIDPIKFNVHKKIETKKEETKKESKNEEGVKPEVNHKPAQDVMDFMAMAGTANMAQIKADKDLTPRIEGFMASFEGAVAQGLLAIEDEFGGALTQADAMALAAEVAFGTEFE